MDETAQDILFNNDGCNFCSELLILLEKQKEPKRKDIQSLVSEIKKKGKGKKYDCIVGISGGVDSSYTLLKAVELGLRPLAVHLDNGWNSEQSQNNISKLINNLNVDLYTHVINWDEYKKLMKSYLKANVVDFDWLVDHAIIAINMKTAKKYGVEFILNGINLATEGMRLPKNWAWNLFDKKNLVSIAKLDGINSFLTYPTISVLEYVYLYKIKKIKLIPTLDYFDYDKNQATVELGKLGYRPYPQKHYESILTRFFQGYILPKKFGIDKRKMFFSTLIISGKMKRNEAIEELKKPTYSSESLLVSDIEYFLKKIDWDKKNFEEYINKPGIDHNYYGSEVKLYDIIFNKQSNLKKIFNIIKYFLGNNLKK